MLLYGAGGHAGVVAAVARDCGKEIKAFFEDDLQKVAFSGIPNLGKYNPELFVDELVLIAIGDNTVRRHISRQVAHRFTNLIHPSALVDQTVVPGSGTVITHGCIIQAGSKIGNHVIINSGAILDHECIVADFVHIAPGAVLCGTVFIGENSFIGAGSCILPNITIGKDCIIGAGSVVTKDIPDGAVVRGKSSEIVRLTAQ